MSNLEGLKMYNTQTLLLQICLGISKVPITEPLTLSRINDHVCRFSICKWILSKKRLIKLKTKSQLVEPPQMIRFPHKKFLKNKKLTHVQCCRTTRLRPTAVSDSEGGN